jgi:hypothetical protein
VILDCELNIGRFGQVVVIDGFLCGFLLFLVVGARDVFTRNNIGFQPVDMDHKLPAVT